MRLEGDRSEGAGGCPAISLLGEPLSLKKQPPTPPPAISSPLALSLPRRLLQNLCGVIERLPFWILIEPCR